MFHSGDARIKGGVITSTGVLQPLAPQNPEMANFDVTLELELQRRTNMNPYPFDGRPDSLGVYQFQWAFTTLDDASSQYSIVDVNRPVFSCLNGLSTATPIKFVGMIQHTVIPGENKDSSVAVRIGGTCTGLNTGPHMIGANDIVGWDYPDFTTDDPNVRRPLFRVKGIPESTFVPVTIPLSRVSAAGILRGITQEFFRVCYRVSGNGSPGNRSDFADVVDKIRKNPEMQKRVRDDMANIHRRDCIIKSTSDTRGVLRRFVEALLASVGCGDGSFTWNEGADELDNEDIFGEKESGTSIYTRQMLAAPRSRKRKLLEFESSTDANHAAASSPLIILDHLIQFQAELWAILQQRIMGVSLSHSRPGGSLDLMMNRVIPQA